MDSKIIAQMYRNVYKNAKTRGIDFEITLEEFNQLLAEADGKCCLTKIAFDTSLPNGKKRPFAASLDRIDSNKGYTYDNCRFLVSAMNQALGWYGDEIFKRIAFAYLANCETQNFQSYKNGLLEKARGVYPYKRYGELHYQARIHTKYLEKRISGFKNENDAHQAFLELKKQEQILRNEALIAINTPSKLIDVT
jgi:hypothetical protein